MKHSITYNCGSIKLSVPNEVVVAPDEEPAAASQMITEAMEVAVEEAGVTQEVLIEDIVVESVQDVYFVQPE